MELDPKEVLFHLNHMGYKNITATQLKDFMKDLKKLIAYETKSTKCGKGNRNFVQECMKSLTAGARKDPSYNSDEGKEKSGQNFVPIDPRPVQKQYENKITKETQNQLKKVSRGVSTDQRNIEEVQVEGRSVQKTQENKENVSRPSSRASKASCGTKTFTVDDETSQKSDDRVKMWIRTGRPKSLTQRNDPVELYHKYKREWERNKQLIPGDNDHSELRWRIRTKLLS
uniref:CSON002108 protein n=1 Tax=Culicoides sonorensis TaxID=179676 RepID=A0A336LVF2_CULSO